MTEQELGHLELLLEKFEAHIGHAYCIAYPVIQDGFSIGVYDRKNGHLLTSQSGPTLKSTIAKIKEKV